MAELWKTDVHHFESLGSTNTSLVADAGSGLPAGTVYVADFQTAGRGRRDRTWEAPPKSSLLCSVLLRPTIQLAEAHLATIAMALSARAAVGSATGLTPMLKWPNDLLFNDAKFGGILAEVAAPFADRPGELALVVGIGINLTFSGPPESVATSLLKATGATIDRDGFLSLLLEELGPRQSQLNAAEGRADLLGEYESVLSTLGREVRVELTDSMVTGQAKSIGPSGELGVEIDGVVRFFHAGDVVHLRPTM
jgi:BirA family biotin operon repressor/biotin-[acetyl-CoA-carboxylase] ligase